MADIPGIVASSSLQAGHYARDVAHTRDAGPGGTGAVPPPGALTGVDNAVEADVEVFADAEGSGSQGREEQSEGDANSAEKQGNSGVSTDADGRDHVDIQA